jgi:heavy metal sensor kinase
MTLTLRVRLSAVYVAVFGMLLVGLSVVSYRELAARLDDDASVHLAELAEGLHGFVVVNDDGATIKFDRTDASQSSFVDEATDNYAIYDAESGRLLLKSPGFELLGLPSTPAYAKALSTRSETIDVQTTAGRFRVASSVGGRPGRRYVLQVAKSLATEDTALKRYQDFLLRWVPVALVTAALATWWIAGFALAPLAKVAARARDIDITNLAARLPLRGANDELDHVAASFNDTLARLEHAVGDMRQFSAALAHELRTPLAALRGEIELELRRVGTSDARRNAIGSQLEELDKLKRFIDQTLMLARAESGQIRLTSAPVDLAALGAALVDQLVPVAESRNIDLRSEAAVGVSVDGDAGWLERMVLNLLDNALKYTPEGGRVLLRVRSAPGGAEIEVQDTGVGMTAAVAPHIFDRFYRGDPSRSSEPPGSGLGLSLVKWIVDAHYGRVHVDSQPAAGARFTVWLPEHRPVRADRTD